MLGVGYLVHLSVALIASCGVPLTKVTIAGADAIAKPPMPAVSVMTLSPMSPLASSALNPGSRAPWVLPPAL